MRYKSSLYKYILVSLGLLSFATFTLGEDTASPFDLKCDHIVNPLSIESTAPKFSWKIKSGRRNVKQIAYRVLVSSSAENLNKGVGDFWDSGKIYSRESANIEYAGKKLTSGLRLYWKVIIWDDKNTEIHSEEIYFFETGLLSQMDWIASWIGTPDTIGPDSALTGPATYFRKEFVCPDKINKARLYIAAPGFYELHINGNKTGDQVLSPAPTNFDRRNLDKLLYPYDDQSSKKVLYNTFDVTSLIKNGANAIGVIAGNGWYNQRDRTVEGFMWYDTPRFIFQLEIEDNKGQTHTIISDSTWKYSTGPILHDGIFTGEIYDARLELDGWDNTGYNSESWKNVLLVRPPEGILKAQTAPYDKIIRTKLPAFSQVNDSSYIYTLDETISGWAQLRVKGERGSKIVMNFISEEDKDYGQSDVYILKGEGEEIWEPRFTWHAFIKIAITSPSVKLNQNSVTVKVVHTDVQQTGFFSCSNPLLNKIYENYIRTQYANFHGSFSSDCPHRERLGYTGDGQVITDAAMYSFDMARFFNKWIGDITDAQNKTTGYVPHTAPFGGGGGGPAWGSAMVIMPWKYYNAYGDKNFLVRYYDNMKKWISYLSTRTDERGIIIKEEPGGWCLGDWATPAKIELPEPLVNTCYYYYVTDIMKDVAGILGNKNDSAYFSNLAVKIKNDFNKVYYDNTKKQYWQGIQGANVFPLAFGMVPEEYDNEVFNSLLEHLNKTDFHFDTGIMATPLLLQVLSDRGKQDIAFKLMNQKEFPGFGYVIDSSATCLWENWDGAYSQCHPMYGSVTTWFFNTIAGIKIDKNSPGMQHFILAPEVCGSLTSCNTSSNSLYGEITSNWEVQEGVFIYNVKVPSNTTAEVWLPAASEKDIVVDGKQLSFFKDITVNKSFNGKIILNIGSGKYRFEVKK